MKTLGKFEILERLGQGAMGVVYKARDPRIGRLVALKTITTGLAEDPALLERFYHEAHSAGALQHPNIVTIYELGEADDIPFIAMEYLTGQSLDKLIEGRRILPLSQKVGYVAYLCRALAYAHKQGVVHRDVKPANVMVTSEGTVKVVDFGIARIAENSKSQTGLVIGTLGYMSPQQIEGGRADARSDIWAAGVLFYELLAYRRPFDGENYGALMLNVMTQPIPPLSETAPGTPPDVAAVLDRMLRKDIDERFQSMEEVLIELEPVWRNLQRSEVSDLLAASREMLKAGDAGKAYDTVRRVLQIDSANTQAKSLLEQINAEIRRNRTVSPAERNPLGDETLIGPAMDTIRPSLSSIPALTASRTQSAPAQSGYAGDSINRFRTTGAQRPVAVQPELSYPTPAYAAGLKWKKHMPIALLVLGVMIAGGGTYFFMLRRQGASTSEMKVAEVAPVSSTLSNTEPSNAVPAVPEPASGNLASPGLENRQPTPTGNPVETTGPVHNSVSNVDTNKSIPASPVPQQQPSRDQGGAGQGATPPLSSRTEVAVNNPVPPPTVERPSQPAAASPQPAVPLSQPTTVAAAPSPTPKAVEPVTPSKPGEPPPVVAPSDNLDRQAITVALQQLSAAFSHRSLAELEGIWPKLGPNKSTFKKVFDGTKSLSREFHLQNLNISNGGDTATAVGTYEGKVLDGRGVETPSSGNFYVRFGKKNGRWYIDDASF
ncbi:MAG: protein kinase [Acidobacteriia bacterium]|nr:protein kinase [Terriglobia bacterium]